MSAMGKVATCQIMLTPIQSDNYIETVNNALKIINEYDVTIETNAMATIVKGDINIIIDIVKKLYIEIDKISKFTLDVRFSNACSL